MSRMRRSAVPASAFIARAYPGLSRLRKAPVPDGSAPATTVIGEAGGVPRRRYGAPLRHSFSASQWMPPITFTVTNGYRSSTDASERPVSGRRRAPSVATSTWPPAAVSRTTTETRSSGTRVEKSYVAAMSMNGETNSSLSKIVRTLCPRSLPVTSPGETGTR